MKLIVFNGSPRGSKGNTRVLIDWFINAFNENQTAIFYLREQTKHSEMIEELKRSELVMIAFPLYTDAMPGIVKKFIDNLEDYQGKLRGTKILFLVHSGFSEAVHSRAIERYLKVLSGKLGSYYLGTIIKPGSEGIRIMPPFMTRKTMKTLKKLGEEFIKTKDLDQILIDKLAKPEKMSSSSKVFYKLLSLTGITNFYWNDMLKKNKVYNRRFDAPYGKQE